MADRREGQAADPDCREGNVRWGKFRSCLQDKMDWFFRAFNSTRIYEVAGVGQTMADDHQRMPCVRLADRNRYATDCLSLLTWCRPF